MKRSGSKKLTSAAAQSAHEKEFAKLTFSAGAMPCIDDQPPLIYHLGDRRDQEMREGVEKTLVDYRETLIPSRRLLLDRFEVVDYAVKVVGVGSVGTFCGILLLMSGNGDPLFLQFKEACELVWRPIRGASPFGHAGQRVVVGQRTMQAASDIFLGWATGAGAQKRHFFLRQLSDAKIKPVVEIMKAANLKGYARLCGMASGSSARSLGGCRGIDGLHGQERCFRRCVSRFQRRLCRSK